MKPEITKKQEKLKGLVSIIEIACKKPLTPQQSQDISNWEGKMEFRLGELLNECKVRELDIKIEVYEEVVKVLNQNAKK